MNEYNKIGLIYESVIFESPFGLASNAEEITKEELITKINELEKQGAKPVSITAVTIPGQKNNEFKPIYKVSRINGMIGANYENSVNRQREREEKPADFVRGSGWGTHLSPSLVQGANGISLQIQPSLKKMGEHPSVYVGTQGGKFIVLSKEQYDPFIYKAKDGEGSTQQGVDRAVVLRRVRLDNIVGITISGTEYRIKDFDKTKQEVLNISGIS